MGLYALFIHVSLSRFQSSTQKKKLYCCENVAYSFENDVVQIAAIYYNGRKKI